MYGHSSELVKNSSSKANTDAVKFLIIHLQKAELEINHSHRDGAQLSPSVTSTSKRVRAGGYCKITDSWAISTTLTRCHKNNRFNSHEQTLHENDIQALQDGSSLSRRMTASASFCAGNVSKASISTPALTRTVTCGRCQFISSYQHTNDVQWPVIKCDVNSLSTAINLSWLLFQLRLGAQSPPMGNPWWYLSRLTFTSPCFNSADSVRHSRNTTRLLVYG